MSDDTDSKSLTDAQIDAIAEKAASRALQQVYAEIGRSLVTKILWIAGVAALSFAAAKGWLVGPKP
jgi:hypothetical protein